MIQKIPMSLLHMEDKWLKRGMRLALEASTWSKDPKIGVGACVASFDFRQFSLGFNGFPAGIKDTEERLNDKETKNKLMRHAEANAISNAKFDVEGCVMFVTRHPCSRCVIDHIIPNRIKLVVIYENCKTSDSQSTRFDDLNDALLLLKEAKIHYTYVSGDY